MSVNFYVMPLSWAHQRKTFLGGGLGGVYIRLRFVYFGKRKSVLAPHISPAVRTAPFGETIFQAEKLIKRNQSPKDNQLTQGSDKEQWTISPLVSWN